MLSSSQMNFNAIGKHVMQRTTINRHWKSFSVLAAVWNSSCFVLVICGKTLVIIKFSRPKGKKLSQSSGKVCTAHSSTGWFGSYSRWELTVPFFWPRIFQEIKSPGKLDKKSSGLEWSETCSMVRNKAICTFFKWREKWFFKKKKKKVLSKIKRLHVLNEKYSPKEVTKQEL